MEPPEKHPNYDDLNRRLAGHFAYATWRIALQSGMAMEAHRVALLQSGLLELSFAFRGCGEFTDQAAASLAESLPVSAEILTLAFGMTPVGDAGAVAIGEALARLKCLRELHLKP